MLKEQNLLEQVNKSGSKLKSGLIAMENEFSNKINSTRGRGTFLAINATTPKLRDELVQRLKIKGKIFKVMFNRVWCYTDKLRTVMGSKRNLLLHIQDLYHK